MEQDSLFQSEETEPDRLAQVLDTLEERFGEDIVTTGAMWKRKLKDDTTSS